MSNLKIKDVVCPRCERNYRQSVLELLQIDKSGHCQICRAELSGKYADGQGNALADLIRAARDLRQASADYTNGSEKGEIHYADAIHESVDLLIDALNNYEGDGKQ